MSSRASLWSRGQSLSGHSNSSTSSGLPGDEFHTLQKRQTRDRLEAHFSHHGSSTRSHPRTSYQDVFLPQDDRVRISEVKNATRRALGSSFDFTDGGYSRTKRVDSLKTPHAAGSRRGGSKYDEPIPQKYLDEYHKRSREDDEKYDADQYKADFTSFARWRTHDVLDVNNGAIRPPNSYRETAHSSAHLRSMDSVMDDKREVARPPLVSKFSFDSDMAEWRNSVGIPGA
ncbi:uncharacterized protein K460DRAFT_413497 [Cucurbitaria berberidis CBS 394.84]|uniref:Uncharacterized protein n=1 Tax=Cucurbitaria berberidis CBS 394.84 TaxID=1168544 RepID=A0A9P4GSM4_9PLEO|nr:uncharacterized protein K460DRAFT_413497 [Cucurbitaria berberidis CBS 394.84]KAF1852018.1 hypothetical protein K460DRAFT_413497 [Cucurbitaria berberidis CBS 394.84]